MQLSNNYNIVSSFICWNQNIVHMKILDTSFKMTKKRFRFRVKDVYYKSKYEIRVSIIFKLLIFHSFKASGSTISSLHQQLQKSFKEAGISLRHLGKSILEGNLYLGPLEIILPTLASGMTFILPVITCPA